MFSAGKALHSVPLGATHSTLPVLSPQRRTRPTTEQPAALVPERPVECPVVPPRAHVSNHHRPCAALAPRRQQLDAAKILLHTGSHKQRCRLCGCGSKSQACNGTSESPATGAKRASKSPCC